MFRDICGCVWARRNDLEFLAARILQCRSREFCRKAPSFQLRRNFRVLNDHSSGLNSVNDKRRESVHFRFKAVRGFVVRYLYLVQIKLHYELFPSELETSSDEN